MPRLRSPRARRGNVLLRLAALSLALLTLTGCSTTQIIDVGQPSGDGGAGAHRYQARAFSSFRHRDDRGRLRGVGGGEFRAVAEELKRRGLEEYHRLYDIYDEYEGINNVKTINDAAGQGPVEVDERIIDLLLFCRRDVRRDGRQAGRRHGRRAGSSGTMRARPGNSSEDGGSGPGCARGSRGALRL